ncbi:oligopeptide ABC transporter substrate-binding protein OppA [Pasteurellaceae bacterium HPA106]|uniref:ABC transporter substrate-binding protein n=1 Tax=Spirabiliibacterium pneumoniae TaxID=221400 RepID=UPI001AADC881|nr:ABC transporter substrate-binding protein [Spirabiliibacterium pneumoniae]MBE2896147.1 oligopeptide ABC transporter substrate-binding protein OppA [Spirabiliibacterium pneumoniae]
MTLHLSRLSLAMALGVSALCANTFAAQVPAGTELAEKQEVIFNNSAEPASLDPAKIQGDVEGGLAHQLYEGLVNSDEKGNILPGVAKSWEHSDDYKTWTFHLRDNAKWSNGEPVTAHDFVYSWQRLTDPKTASPYQTYLEFLSMKNIKDVAEGKKPVSELGVKAVDDYTLQLDLDAPIPYVDKLVEHYVLLPVNKNTVEKYGDQWTKAGNIVGNGAFKLDEHRVNEKIVLTRNPHYWDNEHTVLNKVTFLPIVEGSTDVNRYRAGEVDITGKTLPPEMFPKLKKELPNELVVGPILCTYNYEINNKKAPFNDARVRKALALSLDRNIITDKVLAQGQTPAYVFTPPSTADSQSIKNPEWANWSQQQRNEEAKKLLSEAGFNKSHPLNFNLLYNTDENHKKAAIAASSIWKKNLDGIVNVKLENQEWKTYIDTRHSGNYDIARAGWCADYNEPTTFLNYYLSNFPANTAFYNNPEYDKLLADAKVAPTDEQRLADYAKAEELLNKDMPAINVYHYVQPRLVKSYVKGFAALNPTQSYYFKDVYIVKH